MKLFLCSDVTGQTGTLQIVMCFAPVGMAVISYLFSANIQVTVYLNFP
jgi:hypothetical protein